MMVVKKTMMVLTVIVHPHMQKKVFAYIFMLKDEKADKILVQVKSWKPFHFGKGVAQTI